MKRRRDRPLREDEIALWAHVAGGVVPLPGRRVPVPSSETPAEEAELAPVRVLSATSTASLRPALPPLGPLERRTRVALRRGAQPIEAVLDLHGMRQNEAHDALQRFLRRAQRDSQKLVLIVTGKGAAAAEGGPEERGVLRRVVPHWLRRPELRPLVVGFEEAAGRHGGSGALYVRLRRSSGRERRAE